MNRGSPRTTVPWTRKPHTFNEAPIHESGKSYVDTDGRAGGTSFNEAPIHESGKSVSGPRECSSTGPFNEAPIHESGKWAATTFSASGSRSLQ